MKYFFALILIIFIGCNNHSTSPVPVPPITDPPPTTPTTPPTPTPTTPEYNDRITALSISNSLDRANVNDNLIIYVQVKNSGNDICNMCNVGIRYSLKSITGDTVFDGDITDGTFAIDNLMPGQLGTIEIKFPVKQIGNYTFYLTDLFGVFKGTNSTKHFDIPANAKTYLTVL